MSRLSSSRCRTRRAHWSKPPIRSPIVKSPQEKASPDADCQLPLVALAEQELPTRPDWESLLGDGVQPALILGAERRSQGTRQASDVTKSTP